MQSENITKEELATNAIIAGNHAIIQINKILESLKNKEHNAQSIIEAGLIFKAISCAVKLVYHNTFNDM